MGAGCRAWGLEFRIWHLAVLKANGGQLRRLQLNLSKKLLAAFILLVKQQLVIDPEPGIGRYSMGFNTNGVYLKLGFKAHLVILNLPSYRRSRPLNLLLKQMVLVGYGYEFSIYHFGAALRPPHSGGIHNHSGSRGSPVRISIRIGSRFLWILQFEMPIVI